MNDDNYAVELAVNYRCLLTTVGGSSRQGIGSSFLSKMSMYAELTDMNYLLLRRFVLTSGLGTPFIYIPVKIDSMISNDGLLRLILIIVVAILLVPFLMMLLMVQLVGFGQMWYFNGTRGALWPLLVVGLICLIVIFGIIYLLYRAILGLPRDRSDAALEELRRTYARGELSDEEFEERRERLQGKG